MDYGGNDRRRTKKDLKRKRLARGYKRGGQFRSQEVSEIGGVDENKKEIDLKDKKKEKSKRGKKRK